MLRSVALAAGLLAAVPAIAGEMNYDEARHFVAGKLFSYTCFEGTRGVGRVFPDGSVVGSIQFQGSGPVRYAHLPAGTLKSKGGAVCASLRGLPMEPCFNVERISETSFRGSVSGLQLHVVRVHPPQWPGERDPQCQQQSAVGLAALDHGGQSLAPHTRPENAKWLPISLTVRNLLMQSRNNSAWQSKSRRPFFRSRYFSCWPKRHYGSLNILARIGPQHGQAPSVRRFITRKSSGAILGRASPSARGATAS